MAATSLGAGLLSGLAAAQRTADSRAMAPSYAATGVLPPKQLKACTAMPGVGQQFTTTQMNRHVIGAAARSGSQSGSPPAWDPV